MQDLAIDALAVNSQAEDERGLANGLMFGGASIGQGPGGAGMLFPAGCIGFQAAYCFVASAILLVTLSVVLPMREVSVPRRLGVFLLASASVLGRSVPRLARLSPWLAVLLLAMYARRWTGRLEGVAGAIAEGSLRAVPVLAGALLLAYALQPWRELRQTASSV
jgi:hypothetical protein